MSLALYSYIVDYIIFSLAIFSMTSMILYTSLFEKFRERWISIFEGRLLDNLVVCQLCISFWIALALYSFKESQLNIDSVIVAFGIAGISWLLGAFTQCCLWFTALIKKLLENIDENK